MDIPVVAPFGKVRVAWLRSRINSPSARIASACPERMCRKGSSGFNNRQKVLQPNPVYSWGKLINM